MCLELRRESNKPYNKSKFRWKVIEKFRHENYHADYQVYQGSQYNPRGQWNEALGDPEAREFFGFHVFVTKKDARAERRFLKAFHTAVVKVQVDGFLASGIFDGRRSETWRRMKILRRQ